MPYALSTDMQEEEIIFGGEKKLKKAIEEAIELFHPKAIGIFSTCPVGLIGDDVHAVAREMEEKYPGVNIFGFSCEGYKGVSQSAGHHVANNKVFTDVVGQLEAPKKGSSGSISWASTTSAATPSRSSASPSTAASPLHSTFSGNSEYDEFASAHTADLNVVMCHRSINYMAEMMEKRYGIPWFKVNFIGAEATAKSLRKIAAYFGDRGADRAGGAGDSRGDGGGGARAGGRQIAMRGQSGHALCRRLAGPSLPGALRGDRHEDRLRRI